MHSLLQITNFHDIQNMKEAKKEEGDEENKKGDEEEEKGERMAQKKLQQ